MPETPDSTEAWQVWQSRDRKESVLLRAADPQRWLTVDGYGLQMLLMREFQATSAEEARGIYHVWLEDAPKNS